MQITGHSEKAWTFLDPKPIVIYESKYDTYICYWNGVGLTRSYALMIWAEIWCSVYSGQSAKDVAFKEFEKLYKSNGFEHKNWDDSLSKHNSNSYYSFIKHLITKSDIYFFKKLKDNYSAKEVLGWFDPNKTIVKNTIRS